MKRIAIFGGSFNPIHNGHLLVAQAVFEAFGFDKLLLVPCQVSPFKQGQDEATVADASHRLEMLRLSVAHDSRFEVCDSEVKRQGVSYTIDTVREFATHNPNARFSIVMGMDALLDLYRWWQANDLVALCDIVTVQRPGCVEMPSPSDLHFPLDVAEKIIKNRVRGRLCEISSSEIRQRIAEGRSIRYLVPLAVEAYILQNNLYRPVASTT
ncbi:MAG: nicotinate-nucleotide adenylyltransferase [bacterium]